MATEPSRVWRIKTANASGWVGHIWRDEPLITGIVDQAMEWRDEADAHAMAATFNRLPDRVHFVVVAGEPTPGGVQPHYVP